MPKPLHHEQAHSAVEQASIAEKINQVIIAVLYWILQVGLRLQIDEKSYENLEKLDQALLTTSAIAIFYHASMKDALVLPVALRSELENLKKMLGPVAISHYQGWKKSYMDLMGAMTGSVALPVIREKDQAEFTAEEKMHLMKNLVKTTRQYLEQPGSLYAVAPMGTRAKKLDSTKVNPSFAKLARDKQLPIVPIATYQDEAGQTQLKVGEILPAPANSADLEQAANYYMSQLAQLLSLELQGDYAQAE